MLSQVGCIFPTPPCLDNLKFSSPHVQACFWDTSDLSVMRCVRVTNTVLRADIQGGFLAIGSTSVQLVDTCNLDKRRTVADDTVSDESLEVGRVGG